MPEPTAGGVMLVDHQTHPTSDSTGGTNSRGAAPIAKATTKLSTKTAGGIANPTVRAADVNTAAKSHHRVSPH